ncbi:MAG: SH3 domain-containing protein [Chloroflexi bacterium]|nr:SH3 domain-containing protein [Chloroflexota bacterium]
MLTAVLNIVFAGVAGLAILAALYYGGRAVVGRSRSTKSAYNVGRQQARQFVRLDLVRALALIVLALIFLGAFGLSPRPTEPLISPTEPVLIEATMPATEPAATATVAPTEQQPTNTPAVPTPEAVAPIATPSPTPIPSASPTETVENVVETAVVASGVGVWLRDMPSTDGEQMEWLLDGTELIVLAGQETADNLAWQQVQTTEGFVGWVAVPFIVYATDE